MVSNGRKTFINYYYHEDSNKGYIFEVDVEYSKKMFNFHMDLPFLPERRKIER